jgi:predicted N-acyltransferase
MCSVVVRPGLSLESVMPELEPALDQLRRKEKRPLISIGNVAASDLPCWQQAGFQAYPQRSVSSLDLPATYAGYLDSLQRKDRQRLRRLHKRAAELDVRIETGALADDTQQIFPLLCEVYAKYGIPQKAMPFTPRLLSGMEKEMPGSILVIRGYVGNELAGVALSLLGDSVLLGLMIGLHYETARPSYLYFLLQDEVIRWGIQHGLRRVYAGRSNEREKQEQGFHLEDRWLCYRAGVRPVNRALSMALPWVGRLSRRTWLGSPKAKTEQEQ